MRTLEAAIDIIVPDYKSKELVFIAVRAITHKHKHIHTYISLFCQNLHLNHFKMSENNKDNAIDLVCLIILEFLAKGIVILSMKMIKHLIFQISST